MTATPVFMGGRAAVLAVAAIAIVSGATVATQPAVRRAAGQLLEPRVTAAPAVVDRHRSAAEQAIQRGYLKGTAQLDEVHKLTLAIPAAQARSIEEQARADLRRIRHDALAAVGTRLGMSAAVLDAYVLSSETRLADQPPADDAPALLAPDLYALVARADDLFQRSADAATRALTSAPATPSPSPTGR